MNVVGSIDSAPPLEAAVIVPLLVKEVPIMLRRRRCRRLADVPLIDDAVACVATSFHVRVAAFGRWYVRAQGQTDPAPVELLLRARWYPVVLPD